MIPICSGLVTHSNGSMEIVVTTGYHNFINTQTEILNLDTMTWRAGPPFPTEERTYEGFSLPYANSFVAIGGYTYFHGERNEIWYFNPDSYEWDVISTMAQQRRYLTAIAMPDNVCG